MTLDISFFASLRDRDLSREGYMIGEGRLLAERMLASSCEMIGLLCSPENAEEMKTLSRGQCPIQIMTESEISTVAGFPFHRGVMAAARIPELATLSDWDAICPYTSLERPNDFKAHPCRCVICPEVSEPDNLGSIYRCAAALGWDAVLLGPSCTSPFSRRALRSSMGASLTTQTIQLSGPDDLSELLLRGFLILGTSIKDEAQELEDLSGQLKQLGRLNADRIPIALMFGNEFRGLDSEWEAACKRLVRIPMHGGTDSLNIAVAAGIFMYELGRRIDR